jgi:cytochrome c oxidase subunit III
MKQATATKLPVPPEISPEHTLSAAEWGMASFLLSEVAFFGTLIVTYVAFMGRDLIGPSPKEALSLPLVIVSTICLVVSSLFIHAAEKAIHRDRTSQFCLLLAITIALGIAFLVLTGVEWHDLITSKQLTIGRNLFGTTYYTLVGFHGLHVSVGIIAMLIVFGLAIAGQLTTSHRMGVRLVGWYWHFVDVVWIAVFFVVYIASRGGGA